MQKLSKDIAGLLDIDEEDETGMILPKRRLKRKGSPIRSKSTQRNNAKLTMNKKGPQKQAFNTQKNESPSNLVEDNQDSQKKLRRDPSGANDQIEPNIKPAVQLFGDISEV